MRAVLLGRKAVVCRAAIEGNLKHPWELVVARDAAEALRHEWIGAAEAIVGGPLTPELVAAARSLRLFQAPRAGLDHLGIELLPGRVAVANTFHHEVSIAEYVIMALLMLARRPHEYDRRLRAGGWEGSCIWGELPVLPVLQGAGVMVLGSGHIAREILCRARAFGVRPIVVSRYPERVRADGARVVSYAEWRNLLPEVDYLVPCCPLTAETRGLIGAAELARMKPGACLINIARADIADEQALYEALRDGRLGGAALDVWYRYPRSEDEVCFPSRFPFHDLSNVLLTPHVSGWTRQTVEGRGRDIAANLDRLAAGETLINSVER